MQYALLETKEAAVQRKIIEKSKKEIAKIIGKDRIRKIENPFREGEIAEAKLRLIEIKQKYHIYT